MSDQHGHDDWFRHSADEALPQQEHAAHVNTTAIGLTLLAIVFGVLFTVVVLSMYFVQYANTRKAEMNEGTGRRRGLPRLPRPVRGPAELARAGSTGPRAPSTCPSTTRWTRSSRSTRCPA
jgi:cell division protein FtsN